MTPGCGRGSLRTTPAFDRAGFDDRFWRSPSSEPGSPGKGLI